MFKTNFWYFQKGDASNESNQQNQSTRLSQRIKCNTHEKEFSDKNGMMHLKKGEHSSTIICKYFLINNCGRSARQGADCWYRHEMLPGTALNVARSNQNIPEPGSTSWNTNIPKLPILSQSAVVGLNMYNQTMIKSGYHIINTKEKKNIKKMPISVVFNNSKIVLTSPMKRVLKRGFKFSVLPLKLDITQLLTEFGRLPSIPNITQKHYRSMVTQDRYLQTVFPEPPLIAFRRQKNISKSFIRAKVPPPHTRENIQLNGMKKCGKFIICSYVIEGNIVKTKILYGELTRKYHVQILI